MAKIAQTADRLHPPKAPLRFCAAQAHLAGLLVARELAEEGMRLLKVVAADREARDMEFSTRERVTMPRRGEPIPLDAYFEGREPEARALFEAVRVAVEAAGPAEIRPTKSQVAFRRRLGFAWVWIPGQYLRGKTAPLVLTIDLHRRDTSPRWKEVVEPRRGRFTHHLELHSADQIDGEVLGWLREAWEQAE